MRNGGVALFNLERINASVGGLSDVTIEETAFKNGLRIVWA
jgi:hypothetical protein